MSFVWFYVLWEAVVVRSRLYLDLLVAWSVTLLMIAIINYMQLNWYYYLLVLPMGYGAMLLAEMLIKSKATKKTVVSAVDLSYVALIRAFGNYCYLYKKDGSKELVSCSLASFANARDFVQIHKSYIVNIKLVNKIKKKQNKAATTVYN